MKYEVGDLVRINKRSDSDYGKVYPIVAIGENSDEIKVYTAPIRYKWYRKEDLLPCNKTMKYKVGDKVKVHTIEWFEQNCSKSCLGDFVPKGGGETFVTTMTKFCEQEVTIESVMQTHYTILEDMGNWYWQDWMFEDMNNNNTDTIYNPNIVEDFVKLIGVELDEEFYAKDSGGRYKFTADSGLMIYDDNKKDWGISSHAPFFEMIKKGKFTKTWTPKDGDRVYFPCFSHDSLYDYCIYGYAEKSDKALLRSGLYFKTQEEAIECAKKIIKQMKEG